MGLLIFVYSRSMEVGGWRARKLLTGRKAADDIETMTGVGVEVRGSGRSWLGRELGRPNAGSSVPRLSYRSLWRSFLRFVPG